MQDVNQRRLDLSLAGNGFVLAQGSSDRVRLRLPGRARRSWPS
jgi:hypothetical protein